MYICMCLSINVVGLHLLVIWSAMNCLMSRPLNVLTNLNAPTKIIINYNNLLLHVVKMRE